MGGVQREGESGAEASQAPGTSPTLPQPSPDTPGSPEGSSLRGPGGAESRSDPGQFKALLRKVSARGATNVCIMYSQFFLVTREAWQLCPVPELTRTPSQSLFKPQEGAPGWRQRGTLAWEQKVANGMLHFFTDLVGLPFLRSPSTGVRLVGFYPSGHAGCPAPVCSVKSYFNLREAVLINSPGK